MTSKVFRPVLWGFDWGPTWPGFTDDSTWNGYLNVWVTPDVRDDVVAWMRADAERSKNADAMQEAQDFADLPIENGRVSFARGFTTQERATLAALVAVYRKWNEDQGLSLGSAYDHLFDGGLTEDQRAWLSAFVDEWGQAEDWDRITKRWKTMGEVA